MRVLLLLPTTSYRAEDFLDAAARLGATASVASDRCHVLAELWPPGKDFPPERSLAVDFRDPAGAAAAIAEAARPRGFDAVVATSDETAVIAALASRALGLRGNAPEAAYTARNKLRMRGALAAAGIARPRFAAFALDEEPRAPSFPCVVKPLLLSASRGVIRADDPPSLRAAFERVARLLARPDTVRGDDPDRHQVLVEEFVPGAEVALEGILRGGALGVLALFDKPDPLDGPFFEETIYVTPSRLPAAVQRAVADAAARAARAIGLAEGPIHAELRLPPDGDPVVIEVAARSIGGLCARTLRFALADGDASLEELVLRHALDLPVSETGTETGTGTGASGVMMIPIPAAGVLQAVDGVEAARAVAHVEDVVITTKLGEKLVPLPEGASYLGFLFARAATPALVEEALREAHRQLRFTVAPLL